MKSFVEELKWRGMLQDIMPGTEELLNKGMVTGYIGFDPTADSLGIGNMVQIMTLLHFQQCGHKPVALIGGATGMVGDPSGKSAERNLLDEKTLNHNLNSQKKQLEKFLNFNSGANSAEIVNNYDWFKEFSFLDFIRDVGKHITVNYMMAKDSVKNRLENGMSFTEFSYQLVQGYDFYWLWKNKNIRLQMGGSDQWGNIVTGTELIRRKDGGEAFALTTPLIKKADGTKFGKTEGGNIWLDPAKTTPYQFYQFWLNASDADVKTYIRIFTLFTKEQIETLEKEHDKDPGKRVLQKALAKDITIRVHSETDYNNAVIETEASFNRRFTDLSEQDILNSFKSQPQVHVSRTVLNDGIGIIDFLTLRPDMLPSKSEAKRMIQGGGISVNEVKIAGTDEKITPAHFHHGKFILLEKGKKNKWLVILD